MCGIIMIIVHWVYRSNTGPQDVLQIQFSPSIVELADQRANGAHPIDAVLDLGETGPLRLIILIGAAWCNHT